MEHTVATTIAAVTVYPDRARVTCRGRIPLEPGLHSLLVEELPINLDTDSVRVAGRGTARVRILGVDVVRRFYAETPAVRAQDLEQQIEALEDELRSLKDSQAVLAAQNKYLDGLRQATAEYARGLARGRTTVEDQARLLAFLQEQELAFRAQTHDLDVRQRGLHRQLEKLKAELATIRGARPRQRFQARVEVEVLATGDLALELTYVVGGAGWQPLYDLRLLENGDGQGSLEVTYLAQVSQNSGQDWLSVELSVSTARPALSQRAPELFPWYLNVYVPPPPSPVPMPARAMKAAAAESAPVTAMAMQVAPQAEMTAEVAVAEVRQTGTAVTFAVAGNTDIPGDGSPHKSTIARFRLSPRLDYLAVPRHTDAVFRRVTVTNDSPGPLLAGPAALFAGDDFIGSSQLAYTPAGKEIKLLLGVEERVTVKRELVRRDVDKAILRDRRQLRYGYEIQLENLLAREVTVEVQDQVPVSRHEEIKVKLENVSPPPAERSDLNIIEWRLTLPPTSRQSIFYDYLVEHPRTIQVVGLMD